jgi:hypothetical protein
LADKIVAHVQTTGKPMDENRTARFVKNYQALAQKIETNIEQAKVAAVANPENKQKLEKMQAHEAKRLEKLEALQELMPNASKKQIHALVEQEHSKKHKPKPTGKHPKTPPKE